MHAHKLCDLVLLDDLLVQHRGGALGELVALELLAPLVGLDVAPVQRRLVSRDDRHVDVAARAEVVEDTGLNGLAAQLDGLVLGQARLPGRLEDAHGGQGAGAHGDVGELVGAAVGVHGEEVGAGRVDAGHDQVGADVALVAEEVLLEQRHARHDAGLAARRERVQLQVGRDEGGGELGVGGGAGAGAPDLGSNVVQLFAVLIGDDGARRGSGVGCDLFAVGVSQGG